MKLPAGLEPAIPDYESGAFPSKLWGQNGAADGNRTRVASLEGWSSAIELLLHGMGRQAGVKPDGPCVRNET